MNTERFNIQYWKSQLDQIWLEQMKMIHRGKNLDQIIEYAYGDLISQDRVETATASDFKRLVNSWLSNRKSESGIKKRKDLSHL